MSKENTDRLLSYEGRNHTHGVANFEEQVWVRLDEFVVKSPGLVHFEHLDKDSAYLGIYDADGHGMQFRIYVENGELQVKLDWCEPVQTG